VKNNVDSIYTRVSLRCISCD